MGLIVGSARYDENGNTTGGTAGDQTGSEISTQDYYMHDLGWYCLRATSETHAAALATAMQQACDNDNIGYDQNGRLTVWTQLQSAGTLAKITTACEADCSSLVRCCVYQAMGVDPGNFTTANEATKLAATGLFEDKFSVSSESELYNGDILVTKSKGHSVIVVSGRERSSSSSSSSSTTSSSTSSSSSTTVDSAKSYDASLAGTYTTTANLNLRAGASTSKSILVTIPKGDSVTNYGYYTETDGTKWLYVKYGSYTGFCSSAYLSKGSTSSSSSSSSSSTSSSSSSSSSSSTSVDAAKSYDASLAGKYTVVNCSKLNLRAGAGTSKSILTTLSKGDTVQNYGYYTEVSGTKWLYVKYGSYTGFASASYLSK